MKRILQILGLVLCTHLAWAQQYYPHQMGYAGGTYYNLDTSTTNTYTTFFNGGAYMGSPWVKSLDNDYFKADFRHNLVYVDNAFKEDLFASKGYFGDYVELRWTMIRYENQVTGFRVFRKIAGSTEQPKRIATLSKDVRMWRDEYAETGVLYEYTLYADGIFPVFTHLMNQISGIGFRVPTGQISGRVTFEGGEAVKGVDIIASTTDNFSGKSIDLNGTINSYLRVSHTNDNDKWKFDNGFTFQGWFKPNYGSGTRVLMQKFGQVRLEYDAGIKKVTFKANYDTNPYNSVSVTLNGLDATKFFQVSATKNNNRIYLRVTQDHSKEKTWVDSVDVTNNGAIPFRTNDFLIGSTSSAESFIGTVDEIRIWQKAFSLEDLADNSGMYISGTEDSLTAYFRLNEGTGTRMYDLSRKGYTFNENHGYVHAAATWSNTVPTNTQLAVKGITDKNGNYIVSGIPYNSDGSTYRFTPFLGIHKFDPKEKLLLIGPGSTTHNNVDFVDIASFPVDGYVYYKGTEFPVKDVNIKIDGQLAVNSSGIPIGTDNAGKFTISVPIGEHHLEFVKQGHEFENGRFPATGKWNFQEPYTFQKRISDKTLVRVVGKVVGGPREAAKPKGQGTCNNNIGTATILLGTERDFQLARLQLPVDSTRKDTQFVFINGVRTSKIVSPKTIKKNSLKEVTINTDSENGEFIALLLPEKYVVKSIATDTGSGSGYNFGSEHHVTWDLSSTLQRTEIDSTLDSLNFTTNGDTLWYYSYDSSHYQYAHDFIYRTLPTIAVTNKEGGIAFWDEKVSIDESTSIDVVNTTTKWPLTQWPIFTQRKTYDLKISVFEEYRNGVDSDHVPVTDGTVDVQNGIAIKTDRQIYSIDAQGVANYQFKAGKPKTVGDFTQLLTITANTGKNGAIKTSWKYSPPAGGNSAMQFRGYIIGANPTGKNFVTTGPDEVEMIIRDPYGSNSYAWYEIGNSKSKTTSYSVGNGANSEAKVTAHLGMKQTTFAGVGAGVILTNDITNDIAVGLKSEKQWNEENSSTTTITNTKRWQTSAEPDFVGAKGDVFIGNSTNIVYGKAEALRFTKKSGTCPPNSICIQKGGDYYILEKLDDFRLTPEFSTAFQYSQNHIENYLIPNWEMLRNAYFSKAVTAGLITPINGADGSVSNDIDKEKKVDNFANGDTVITITGDKYNITLNSTTRQAMGYKSISGFIDTVRLYNSQIQNWKNILGQNERDKLEATLEQNLSYDAGVVYSSEFTTDSSSSKSKSFDFAITPSLGGQKGAQISGIGLTMQLNMEYSRSESKASGEEETSTITFGYELSDTDEGDYFSIDVKKPKSATGPVFFTRGGQSSCPHEGEEKTKYFQKGAILSEATQQREKPLITPRSATIVNDIPEDKPAFFNVELANISEAGDDTWLMISVDQKSNQTGAIVKLDGQNISNGRTIFIPAGTTINKVISIEKNQPHINEFNDIGIILHSVCQFDPGDNWPDIADTVKLTAKFKPVCTKVDLKGVPNQWVMNSSNEDRELNFTIENYDLVFTGFEEIHFQTKPTTSSLWTSKQVFTVADCAPTCNGKEWINGKTTLNYTLDMSDLPDRSYDIRAYSTCANGTTNESAILTGIKDTKRPQVFGTPSPGDGILSPGEDVLIVFNEPIFAPDNFEETNVTVKGVLNDAKIDHNSVLFFDGNDDYASVTAASTLTDLSFSFEFWVKRSTLGSQQVILKQEQLEIGFNANNEFYLNLAGQSFTGETSAENIFGNTDKWIHFTVSYNHDTKKLNAYKVFDGSTQPILIDNKDVTSPFNVTGKMYIAADENNANNFGGFMHDLRLWEKALTQAEAIAKKDDILKGDEIGLIGFWPMNELRGPVAADLSRAHHAVLNGPLWKVLPSGFARNFTASGQMDIDNSKSDILITDEMDFTLEFWFKADANQKDKVLFSNGKTDGSESADAEEDIWEIGFNASGNLYAKNKGVNITNTELDLLDDTWHHFALVLRRKGNASIYVNGELSGFKHSSSFGGLKGGEMTFGASRKQTTGTPYTKNFTGSMDEIRFWNLARTKKLLEMDMFSKLQGDELGLVGYYPFEKFDITLALVSTLENMDKVYDPTTKSYIPHNPAVLADHSTGTFETSNVPNIKNARPVQKIGKAIVTAADRVIIELTTEANLIEKTIVEFTVEAVEDLYGNTMASPETWTAYIKRNTVLWDEQNKEFEKMVYDPLSFSVDILNIGGLEETFTISNVPAWLSISEETGVLGPDSRRTLNFTVSEALNIGTHEQNIYLTSDFGFNEVLRLKIKVIGNEPDWEFDPTAFEYSMNIIGQITVDGVISSDIDDKLIALVGDDVRGIANLRYVEEYDMYLAFIDVYANTAGGESVNFYIWDASEGKTHTVVNPSKPITFASNTLEGTPSAPIVFAAINQLYEPIVLNSGWNWVSFPLSTNDHLKSNTLLSDLNPADGDLIKSMTKYDQYGSTVGWTGSLSSSGGVNNRELYKIKITGADTIEYEGARINPENINIDLNPGWSWIGFPNLSNMSIADAFSNLEVKNGDFVKGQNGFAVYDINIGWIGTLDFLKPKKGYMFKSSETVTRTFTFPKHNLYSKSRKIGQDELAALYNEYGLNPYAFKENASIIATTDLSDLNPKRAYRLLAYADGELRGVTESDFGTFFLTLYENTEESLLNFVLEDERGNRFDLNETHLFEANSIIGSKDEPFHFTLGESSSLNSGETGVKVFPSHFSDALNINLLLDREEKVVVSVHTLNGVLVTQLVDETLGEGMHRIAWQLNSQEKAMAPGMFFIKVEIEGATAQTFKVIKTH
ncbi:LamG domain-containing protein [Luteibaculum oceani]|uniref:LamG domain-containing protein n=1 Tax=Luteibaculum oceani TaxID=1294296 RepID=A0A5C6UYW5_9FLAO|nr:LamG domain-containing protein [Luteibaculum oceani]TXC78673.1 LamG domain-containing protein [Luteibaculum oceani]